VREVEPAETRPPGDPPADANDWSHEQWLAWLKATDESAEFDDAATPATPAGRVVHSSGGQLVGQAMLGLARAIYGQRDEEVVIVAEAPSEPEDEILTVHLDPDHPDHSFAIYRGDAGSPTTDS
jgi:hypothetical protein